jgi:hypothetical protein
LGRWAPTSSASRHKCGRYQPAQRPPRVVGGPPGVGGLLLQCLQECREIACGGPGRAYAPETRLIPPAEIPKQAAKAQSKRIKPTTRKLQRPQTVCFLQRNHRYPTPSKRQCRAKPRDSPRGRIRCDRGLPIPKRRHPSTRGFAPSAGACPQKVSKCTYFREERFGRESLPRTAIVTANQVGAG